MRAADLNQLYLRQVSLESGCGTFGNQPVVTGLEVKARVVVVRLGRRRQFSENLQAL
jgi:hypothetical protein